MDCETGQTKVVHAVFDKRIVCIVNRYEPEAGKMSLHGAAI